MALSTVVFADSDPFFSSMDRAVGRMLSNALGVSLPSASGSRTASCQAAVPMDILETATYKLQADAPGMGPQDIKVELHENVLQV
jgi:HSP20 family protein